MVDVRVPVRLLHPKLTVIITSCSSDGRFNAMTAAWAMPVSHRPPLVAVSIAPSRLTYSYVHETGEFVVNVPTVDLLGEVEYFGTVSGRVEDKLARAGLRLGRARRVKPPVILDCAAWLECLVEREVPAGDHLLFIGRVVEAYARDDVFDTAKGVYRVDVFKPVLHLGGDHYTTCIDRELKAS